MLGIILLIGLSIGIGRAAENKGLHKILWGILAFVSFFLAQFIAGLFVGIFSPNLLEDETSLTILGLLSGIAGFVIVWLLMFYIAKRKKAMKEENEGLLDDDQFIEEL